MKLFLFVPFIVCFITITASAQQDVQLVLSAAKGFECNRKYTKAIAELDKAIALEPNNSSLYIKRAANYVHLRNNRAVLEDVQTAISLKPNDVEVLAEGGEQLYLSGQYYESVNIADLLISVGESGSHYGYKLRYLSKFKVRDYEATIEDIIKSRDFQAAFEEGVKPSYSREIQTDYSKGLLFTTLNNLKDNANIYNYYDKLFDYIEEQREAPSTTGASFYRRFFWLTLYVNYMILYEEKRTPAEVAALSNQIEVENGLVTRAEIYKMMGRYDSAIRDLSKSLQASDEKSYKLLARGDLYLLNNQFKESLADYETAKKLNKEIKDYASEKIAAVRKKISDVGAHSNLP